MLPKQIEKKPLIAFTYPFTCTERAYGFLIDTHMYLWTSFSHDLDEDDFDLRVQSDEAFLSEYFF